MNLRYPATCPYTIGDFVPLCDVDIYSVYYDIGDNTECPWMLVTKLESAWLTHTGNWADMSPIRPKPSTEVFDRIRAITNLLYP